MRIRYLDKGFKSQTLDIISNANSIINEYVEDDMTLTVRQLYYQFISRDLFPESWIDYNTGSKNNPKSYGKLSKIISNARLAGLISWTSIRDLTRYLRENPHWSNPGSILRSAANSFRLDKWRNQDYRIEVWIEKEALIGVISSICDELDVPYFACKGYVSQSEMWEASQRIIGYFDEGKEPVIIHLGDHDPSGIDMTRDIIERQDTFLRSDDLHPQIRRIALNIDQIREFNPPPNPTKFSDTRASSYVDEYGIECWELDAMEPRVIRNLIRDQILSLRDESSYNETINEEADYVSWLDNLSRNWRDY